jgi:hypothetical protein
MYMKKIKSLNFMTNQEVERTYYFNLTKAELAEMELSMEGGFKEYVQRIVEAQKTPEIAEVFKQLILKSYGERSDDGMRFIKKDPVRGRLSDEFEQTDAYSELFMELATDEKAATEFINGILPAGLQEEAKRLQDQGHAYPPQVGMKK